MSLQLQVEVPKCVLVPHRHVHRLLGLALQNETRHLRSGAAGESYQAASVRLQQLLVHAGLVIEALEVGLRGQLQQVPVPLHVLCQQQEVVRALVGRALPMAALLGKVGLQPDDRLDARFLALGVELDCPVQPAVVRDCKGFHAKLPGALHHWTDAAEAVEKAVLGVVVQVGKHCVL